MTLDHFTGAGAALALWLALRLLGAILTRARERSPHTRERIARFIKDREL